MGSVRPPSANQVAASGMHGSHRKIGACRIVAPRTLLVGVSVASVAVGCSLASPNSGDVEQAAARPGVSTSPVSGVEPGSMSMEEYGEWSAFVYAEAGRQYQSELANCMAAKGFEYLPLETVWESEQHDNPLIDTSTSESLRRGAEFARESPADFEEELEPLPAGYDEALGGIDETSGCLAEVQRPDLSKVEELSAQVGAVFSDDQMPDSEDAWLRCLEVRGFAAVPSAWGTTYETAQREGQRLLASRGYEIEPQAMILGTSTALDAIPHDTKIEIADELREFELELGEANAECQASSGLAAELQERVAVVLASVDPSVFDITFDEGQ